MNLGPCGYPSEKLFSSQDVQKSPSPIHQVPYLLQTVGSYDS